MAYVYSWGPAGLGELAERSLRAGGLQLAASPTGRRWTPAAQDIGYQQLETWITATRQCTDSRLTPHADTRRQQPSTARWRATSANSVVGDPPLLLLVSETAHRRP